jgi:hypothetical protein
VPNAEQDKLKRTITSVRQQLSAIFENSEQCVYIYLDDTNKVCNEKFASLLGYGSAKEWAAVKENFPDVFVSKNSQRTLIDAYQSAMQKFVGSQNNVTWKTKTGKDVKTTTILVPIVYDGVAMALHFITPA